MKKVYSKISAMALSGLAIVIFALIGTKVNAQSLVAGDVSFISLTANVTPKRFEFVVWKDLGASTEIRFTNCGFTDNTGNTIRWMEQYVIWTGPTTGLTKGTVVRIEGNAANYGSVATYNCSGSGTPSGLTLGNSTGNQIFAFQGAGGNSYTSTAAFAGTLLAGIQYQSTSGLSNWLTTPGTTVTAATSYLPTSISTYSMVLTGSPGPNEGVYSGGRTGFTAVSDYRSRVLDIANWSVQGGTTINPAMKDNTPFAFSTPPSITGQPSNSAICAGANTSFTVVANNATGYQWEVSTGGSYAPVANGGVYSGATTSTLTITGATTGMNSYAYRAVVTGSTTPDATSNSATLTVNSAPSITAHPQNMEICNGNNASFTVSANNATGYQWQANSGSGYMNIANGGVYSGATTSTLLITGANNTMDGNLYRVIVTGNCTPNATSSGALLQVNGAPVFLISPQNEAICEGDNVSLSVFAGNTTSYQWQVNDGGGFVNISDNGTYSGSNTSTLSISTAASSMSGYTYRAVAAGSCSPSATSASATLTVYPLVTYYFDNDGDGYGDAFFTTTSCTGTPFMFVANNLDCNDYDNTIYPFAPEICGDGIDNNCDGNVDEDCIPTTQISASFCGTTINYVAYDEITADAVVGAEDYEFRIFDGSTYTVATESSTLPSVKITDFIGYSYGVTYDMSVRVKVDGAWGDWGPDCAISVTAAPYTELEASQCGSTLASVATNIYAYSIPEATQYRFRLTSGATVLTLDKAIRSFNLAEFTGYAYNTVYQVDVAVYFNGSWSAFGPTCSLTSPSAPTTTIDASQCGTTLASVATTIYANSVVDATQYRFRVTNGANVQVIDRPVRSFALTQLASYAAGTTYTIDVAVEALGSFGPYGSACNVTTPMPVTKVQTSQCGTTLASVATAIYADAVTGATQYRFRVINGANVQTIDRTTRAFSLSQLASYAYGTTYTIDVAVELNGSFGAYGAACNVTTPALVTQVQASQCGTTLASVATAIYADAVTGATQYRFRVINGANVQVIDRSVRSFALNQLASYAYGTTYTIDVAVESNGSFGPYGSACNVTSPSLTTQVQASQCGTTLASIATAIYADAVAGATQYRFRVINGANVQTIDRTTRSFALNQLASYAAGTTYTIDVAVEANGSFGAYGPACNVTTPFYTTQVQASQCGTTLASVATAIYADNVSGATQYRFRVINGANVQTIDRTTRAFSLNQLASYAPGTTYTVDVAVEVNGSFGPYGPACNVTSPAMSTQVQASQCGTTLASIGTAIYADAVAGATQYRFRVINGANIQTIDRTTRAFSLNQLASYANGTTYTIDVAVEINGTFGAYGPACNVTTPSITTKVQASQCGTTLPVLSTVIYAENVSSATEYRFRVTNGANVQTIDRTTRSFSLNQLASYAYNTTYTVDVALKVNGSWEAYGAACNITTPVYPVTKIQATQCGSSISTLSEVLYADNTVGAEKYKFKVSTGSAVDSIERTVRNFTLSSITSLAYGSSATVSVAIYHNGTWHPYGASCVIYIGAPGKPGSAVGEDTPAGVKEAAAFEAAVYPNPFGNEFGLNVTTESNEPVKVSVYDVTGKLMTERSVSVQELSTLRIGESYASGVYHVRVVQGTSFQTLKVIKK